MALITCPECDKQVSDQAKECPHCGLPLSELNLAKMSSDGIEDLEFPELPDGYTIGTPNTNWGGISQFNAKFNVDENSNKTLKTGSITIRIHPGGISISDSIFHDPLEIHFKHIINIDEASGEEIIQKKGSVIGRAVVGTVLLGPVGAIVGGLSGIGHKKYKKLHFLIINYWNPTNKTPDLLILRVKKFYMALILSTLQEAVGEGIKKPILIKTKK